MTAAAVVRVAVVMAKRLSTAPGQSLNDCVKNSPIGLPSTVAAYERNKQRLSGDEMQVASIPHTYPVRNACRAHCYDVIQMPYVGSRGLPKRRRIGVSMRNNLIRLFITVVAVVVIGVRYYKPNITVDETTAMLIALAALPWLSTFIKGFEVFGVKIELQDAKDAPAGEKLANEEVKSPIADRVAKGAAYRDSYFLKMIKLTPLEAIVAFVLTNAMVTLTGSRALIWANFLILVALTPFLLWRASGVTRIGQVAASTMVFVGWVFGIGGPFTMLSWYTSLLGALVLAAMTLTIPLVYRAV